jgi:hypothetical protein
MKRAFKERPRVAAAAVLGVVALVLIGVALGPLMSGGSPTATTATQLRLASAESTARDAARRLRVAEADFDRGRGAAAAFRATLAQARPEKRRAASGASESAARSEWSVAASGDSFEW